MYQQINMLFLHLEMVNASLFNEKIILLLMILGLLTRNFVNLILIFQSNIYNITHQSQVIFNCGEMIEIQILNYPLMLEVDIRSNDIFILLFILRLILFSDNKKIVGLRCQREGKNPCPLRVLRRKSEGLSAQSITIVIHPQ